MTYQQGDIVIVPFPFTNLSGTKVRPAIVVSNSTVHPTGDVIIAQITGQNISSSPLAFKLTNAEVTLPFKPKGGDTNPTMYVYCKKLVTIDSALIYKKITEIQSTHLAPLINTVTDAFKIL